MNEHLPWGCAIRADQLRACDLANVFQSAGGLLITMLELTEEGAPGPGPQPGLFHPARVRESSRERLLPSQCPG